MRRRHVIDLDESTYDLCLRNDIAVMRLVKQILALPGLVDRKYRMVDITLNHNAKSIEIELT